MANLLAENQKYFLWKSIFSREFFEIFRLPKTNKKKRQRKKKKESLALLCFVSSTEQVLCLPQSA